MMQILVGDGSGKRLTKVCQDNGLGRMLSANWPTLYPGEPWGFDNKAFIYWKSGKFFDDNDYLRRLERAQKLHIPYIAIVPDIVAGGMDSLEMSLKWISRLPQDWPWYLAVQDGMDVAAVIEVMGQFAGIFLGGSDDYKKYAGYWCKLAHHFKKKFHYGRAGTLRKVAHALMVGADSLDSAFPLWTKERLSTFLRFFGQAHFDGMALFAPCPGRGDGALTQVKVGN